MYTLPHQVEFLSDRWVEEAKSFLEIADHLRRPLLDPDTAA